MSFLKAEWRELAIANYSVDTNLLQKYVPAGTELDIWNGTCYVSLVGFVFKNVRLLGMKIPFHTSFEEVNLRFYVRFKEGLVWKRGVVFIQEIVPKRMLSFIANTVYKENYRTMPMTHKWINKENEKMVEYNWNHNNQWQKFRVFSDSLLMDIEENSEAEFITEHYWGYNRIDARKTIEYEVTHPKWQKYNVKDYEISVDFSRLYGNDFEILNRMDPVSVIHTNGSKITVENKREIKLHHS